MKISVLERLLESHLPLVKKVIMLALVFWIGAFVFVLVIALVLNLLKIQGYDDWMRSFGLLAIYFYADCVLPSICILATIVVYGKIMRITKLHLVKAETVICVLATVGPIMSAFVLRSLI